MSLLLKKKDEGFRRNKECTDDGVGVDDCIKNKNNIKEMILIKVN